MTIIEAMATGLPLVATSVGGVPDMLVAGESAILTEVNSEQIADAFLSLAYNPALRNKLGECAKLTSKRFSSNAMMKEYCKIYKD